MELAKLFSPNYFSWIPATMQLSGTSLVTTEPAPTSKFSPITIGINVELLPMTAPFLMSVFFHPDFDPVLLKMADTSH